jgi:RIO kinase 1
MPNSPYLDKSVQWRIRTGQLETQEPGYRGTVQAILSAGLATEVVGMVSAGKEADVFLVRYNGAPMAVKAYRLFRTSRRGGGPVKADAMGWLAAHEFEMLHRAWKGGVRVPTPARRVENLLAMRYLGDDGTGPAPRLKEVLLDDPAGFLQEILRGVKKLAEVGLVHGDLSAYNILVHRGEPWFIDFPDCVRVDRLGWPPWHRLDEASRLLTRGLQGVATYFKAYQIPLEVEPFVEGLVGSLDRWARVK